MFRPALFVADQASHPLQNNSLFSAQLWSYKYQQISYLTNCNVQPEYAVYGS